jgi:hypothetical protein
VGIAPLTSLAISTKLAWRKSDNSTPLVYDQSSAPGRAGRRKHSTERAL